MRPIEKKSLLIKLRLRWACWKWLVEGKAAIGRQLVFLQKSRHYIPKIWDSAISSGDTKGASHSSPKPEKQKLIFLKHYKNTSTKLK